MEVVVVWSMVVAIYLLVLLYIWSRASSSEYDILFACTADKWYNSRFCGYAVASQNIWAKAAAESLRPYIISLPKDFTEEILHESDTTFWYCMESFHECSSSGMGSFCETPTTLLRNLTRIIAYNCPGTQPCDSERDRWCLSHPFYPVPQISVESAKVVSFIPNIF